MSVTRRRFLWSTAAVAASPVVAGCARPDRAPSVLPSGPDASAPATASGVDWFMGNEPTALRLNKNENPFGPAPRALEALERGMDHAHRYASSSILRERIGDHLGVDPAQVRLGTGSGEILRMLPFTYLREGGNVVAARQAYRATPSVAADLGHEVRWVDMRGPGSTEHEWRYDVDAMLAAVDEQTRIFYLVNPNNPTGTMLPHAQLRRVLDQLPPSVLVVVDEAYVQFLPEGEPSALELVKSGRQSLLVTRTFSKVYGLAGLRIGFGVADTATIERISSVMMTGPNVMAYGGAIAALEDQAHVDRFVAHAGECRAFYEEALTGLGLNYVSGYAPLIMAELGDRVPAVIEAMAAQGVLIRDGRSWEVPAHVRISYGTHEQNRRVIETLAAVL